MLSRRTSALAAALLALWIAIPAGAGEPGGTTLPRLVDLGANKCIPCKKMAPILEQLKKDYHGIVDVHFVDVWKDPKGGEPYGIRVIPTQVFFDRDGKEVFRHEGFFSREEIERVFKDKLAVEPLADQKKAGVQGVPAPGPPRPPAPAVEEQR